MAAYPLENWPYGIPTDTEAQLKATVTEVLSKWLDIFATSLTITHKSSRWRYVRFHGCVNGSKKKVMLARLTTLPMRSVGIECGGSCRRPYNPCCKVKIRMFIAVSTPWKAALQNVLLEVIARRWQTDYDLSWQTTRYIPRVVPISQTVIRLPVSSPQAACSQRWLRECITSITTASSTE